MRKVFSVAAGTVAIVLVAAAARAQNTCPISYGGADDAKPNKVYLYFPAVDDATYPEFGATFGLPTQPAHRFDVAELGSYTGTVAQLRDAVTNVVAVTYCEFNVQVRQTTTLPPTTFARRNTIAIGTDAQGACGGETWGLAQAVDTGDPTAVDFARVWAGSYQNCAGGAGGALNGASSTLERWARSIGGTASHEAGHNYGMSHADGLTLAAGEDALVHHVMASGSHYSYAARAGFRRHFSDREYSLLAANVGLSVQTMWNWDMVNPDAGTGVKLQMDFLSTLPSLILSWSWGGSSSPWVNPTVTGPSGTQVFKGTTYNKYRIEWATGHAWNGPTPGRVGGGMPFHVGATFSSVGFSNPAAILVTDVRLIDSANNALPLHPRIAAFDAGTPDQADGTLTMRIFNMGPALELRRLQVLQLPRVASLDTMVPGRTLADLVGVRVRPWGGYDVPPVKPQTIKESGELKVPLARLNQRPHVTQRVTEADCAAEDRMKGRDTATCRPGTRNDLFPSTTVFVRAELVDPVARHWDPKTKQYVVGPVTTTVFYQIAGSPRREPRE
jgi:hypothetical protein